MGEAFATPKTRQTCLFTNEECCFTFQSDKFNTRFKEEIITIDWETFLVIGGKNWIFFLFFLFFFFVHNPINLGVDNKNERGEPLISMINSTTN